MDGKGLSTAPGPPHVPKPRVVTNEISDLECGVVYLPNFMTEEEEEYLIRKIQESPQPKWKKLPNRRLQIWGGEMTAKAILCAEPMPPFVCKYPDIIGRIKATGVFDASPHGQPNHIIMNEYDAGQGIMPHEDGPKYHPVVATLSLGSHCVLHYYRYNEPLGLAAEGGGMGRSIDPDPVVSILLERRSLVISSGDMYTSHLHGITSTSQDLIHPPPRNLEAEKISVTAVRISNWDLLQDEALKEKIRYGEVLQRSTRWSLTCRDVPRVSANIQRLRSIARRP